jgi:SAM-dependent methyltransferase
MMRRAWVQLRRATGYDHTNWLRIRQIESIEKFFSEHAPGNILEISPGWNGYWRKLNPGGYRSVDFPDFDITREVLPESFDYIIADQVLEHVPQPRNALVHIHSMLNEGGHAIVSTPFLFRVHARPHDYYRWTAAGLRLLLTESGFAEDGIETHSWGNKACARAHIGGRVRDFGYGKDLTNDEEYPLMVWAFARK